MTKAEDAAARILDASRRQKRAKAFTRKIRKGELLDMRLVDQSRSLVAESRAILDNDK